ncbi:hypothetical protein SAMN04488550_4123 [Gordonia malaquae]|uniref:Major tail protein n=1 Tax=Gordonia malaquae NBRC 108250 TaxID=1223542 RepID=M3UMS2_GORML|nr:hypothetical protein [Gordonia malaquae]GAC81225.1 hypothetical protein GM1_030_00540 [Gordonia malaquae NBRC 108250]SEE23894.1 hypothetical protein SAMN04488550_4123 [Gordonia malaquae]
MADLDQLAKDNAGNIMKFTRAVLFFGPADADIPDALTEATAGQPPVLSALPTGYVPAGLIKKDGGFEFGADRDISETESLGYASPTRRDVQKEDVTISYALQEFKRSSFERYFGLDLSGVTVDATTGEVSFARPITPGLIDFRAFIIARDRSGPQETYFGRFFPKAQITEVDSSSFSAEDEFAFPVTMTGQPDPVVGYSEKFFIGGAGFKARGTAGHGFGTP